MEKTEAEWRRFAKPEEIELHDQLIEVAHENAAYRKIIRNRCRMRGKAKPC